MTMTTKGNLVDVTVFSQSVSDKLEGKIRLLPLAYVESFEGVQASVVDVPKEVYIGDAEAVAEGEALDYTQMTQDKDSVEFKNYAKGVKITDQAMRGGFGDPIGSAERQVLAAIAGGIEKEMVESLGKAKLQVKGALTSANLLKAVGVLGETFEDAPVYLLINPVDLPAVEKDIKTADKTELNGRIYSTTILTSSRVKAGEAFLVQEGALGLYIAKDVEVEANRDIDHFATKIVASEQAGVHLRDESKAVKIAANAVEA